jgi:hypothetical protein
MVSMFFIIAAMGQWWSMAEQRNVISVCFDSAFLIGLATIIYLPSGVMLFQAFTSLMLFRTFNFREALYTLIGFLLPLLFWITTCFVLQWNYFTKTEILPSFVWNKSLDDLIWQVSAGVLILFSVLHFLSVTPQQVIRVRKMRSLVFFFLFFSCLPLVVYYWGNHTLTFPYLTLPALSVFVSGFIVGNHRAGIAVWLTYLVWFIFLYVRFYSGYE